MKRLILAITLLFIIALHACKKSKPGSNPAPPSTNKSVTSFIIKASENTGLTTDITGQVTADSIILSVPNGINVSSLKPTIVHNGISISPLSGDIQDFNSPVNYIVKAADNSTKSYVAAVRITVSSTVYVGSGDGKLYALNGDNGAVKWTFASNGVFNAATPTYNNGTVFIGSSDKYLYAIDAVTGVLKWKYLTHGDLSYSTPTYNNGVLYFSGYNSSLTSSYPYTYAVNAQNGTLIWESLEFFFQSPATVYNNIIYTGGFGGLRGVDALTGTGLLGFTFDICGDNPLVVNGIMYSGTETHNVSAYNATTGALVWHYNDLSGISGNSKSAGPTLKNGIVYNGSYQQIFAMDSATGKGRWKYPSSAGMAGLFSAPTVENGIVYAGNTDSYFYALDAYTGDLRWKFGSQVGQAFACNGTVAGNIVYFGNADQKVYALNAITGAVRWQYATGGAVYGGPLVVTDNQVVYHAGISGEHH